ncbi:MAG: DUF1249 domain-containing protein [Xanthomonadales bacterium]
MVAFASKKPVPGSPEHALRRLQQTQEEIYRQLLLLVPDDSVFHDAMVSRVAGSPLLRLDVIERHPYTTFYRLTYEFREGEDCSFAPDAHIRLYRDAHLAEATSYNPAQGFRRTAHPSYPSLHLLREAWRRNRALDRWLDYLLRQGHSVDTMRPARASAGNRAGACAFVEIG